jgi:outer membrane protein assembly factor BamB
MQSCRLFSLHVLEALAIVGLPGLAQAGDEDWLRFHLGTAITQDAIKDIAVHPSGELSVVAASSGQILVLRLGADGEERWSRFEPIQWYLLDPIHAVASEEDLFVTANSVYCEYNYYCYNQPIVLRYDSSGMKIGEATAGGPNARISDAAADGSGGVILSGSLFPPPDDPICPGPCDGFAERRDRDGQRLWFSHQFPDSLFYLSGNLGPAAVDSAGNSIIAGEAFDHWDRSHRIMLNKYLADGRLEWQFRVFVWPTPPQASAVGLAADGSSTVVGTRAGETWAARHGADGQQLWLHSPPAESGPSLAVSPEGVSYIATAIAGQSPGSDIVLTAYGPGGEVLWERTYDSGPETVDHPVAVTLTPDGSIVVLGTISERIGLLKYDHLGELILASRYEDMPAAAKVLTTDSLGRLIAGGSTNQNGEDLDLLVFEFTSSGDVHLLARCCDVATAIRSSPIATTVASNDGIITAYESVYGSVSPPSLDLVRYHPDGTEAWLHVEPRFEVKGAAFDGSGAAVAAGLLDEEIHVLRVDSAGQVSWNRSLGPEQSWPLKGLLVAVGGESILVRTGSNGTRLVAIDPKGHQSWDHFELEIRNVLGQALGQDGRIYLREDGVPRIHCFASNGALEWSESYPSPAGLSLRAMEPAQTSGFLYIAGSQITGEREEWMAGHIRPGGDIDWVAVNGASPGRRSYVSFLKAYPDGGVVALGSEQDEIDSDVVVIRYAPDGTVLWRAAVNTDQVEIPYSLAVDPYGDVLVLLDNQTVRETHTLRYSPAGELIDDLTFADGDQKVVSRIIAVGQGSNATSIAIAGGSLVGPGFTLKYSPADPVEITSLAAERIEEDVRITWSVGAGLEPAGFDVLHAPSLEEVYRPLTDGLSAEARSYVHHDPPPGDAYYLLEVIELDGSRVRYGPVPAMAAPFPVAFWVAPPRPNPAAGAVEWQLGLPALGRVRLAVHDVAGRVVAVVTDATMPAGIHRIQWDRSRDHAVPAGVYYFRIEAGGEKRVGKLVLGPAL